MCRGFLSLPHKSIHFTSDKHRDILIRLTMLCAETDITCFVNNIVDLGLLFKNENPIINSFFESHSFIQTNNSSNIDTVIWKSNAKKKLLRYQHSFTNEQELNSRLTNTRESDNIML